MHDTMQSIDEHTDGILLEATRRSGDEHNMHGGMNEHSDDTSGAPAPSPKALLIFGVADSAAFASMCRFDARRGHQCSAPRDSECIA